MTLRKNLARPILLLVPLSAVAFACSSSSAGPNGTPSTTDGGPGEGSSSGSPGTDGGGGQTSCNGATVTGDQYCTVTKATCHAGTYCNPSVGTFDYCLRGCLSDLNCAPNQHCLLGCDANFPDIGSCRPCSQTSCTTTPAGSSCAPTSVTSPSCPSPGVVYGCKSAADTPAGDAGTCTELPTGEPPPAGSTTGYCCGAAVNPCRRSTELDQPMCTGKNKKAYDCAGVDPPSSCTTSPQPGTYCCP